MGELSERAFGAKPCPFCGDDKLFVEREDENSLWGVECYTKECLASGPREFTEPARAIKAWNKRAKKGQTNWLLIAERVVLTVAGLFALFPLYQFNAEFEDRRLDRAANFISAHKVCSDLGIEYWATDDLMPPGATLEGFVPNPGGEGGFLLDPEFAEKNPDFVLSLRRNVQLQCQYIHSVNESRSFFN